MTDIVERLRARGWGVNAESAREAADEIERLREEVEALRLVATSHEPEALRLQAEVEHLRTQLAIQFGMHPGGDLAEAARAEIERLRTTIGYLADNISDYPALVAVAEAALVRKGSGP